MMDGLNTRLDERWCSGEIEAIPKACVSVTLPLVRETNPRPNTVILPYLSVSGERERVSSSSRKDPIKSGNSTSSARVGGGCFGECIDAVLFGKNGGMRGFWFWIVCVCEGGEGLVNP